MTWVAARLRISVNLPNYITMTRIFSVPVLIWVLSSHLFHGTDGRREILASALFIAASISDGIDGYLARRWGQITTLGVLLDPLADKLLITAAFVALVQFNPVVVPAWIAVIVIGREFLVSGLRAIAASEGFTIAASDLGKLKMVVQIVSVVAAILAHRWVVWQIGRFIIGVEFIAHMAVWFMVAVSLISAIDYFVAFWSKIEKSSTRRRKRRAFILRRPQKFGVAPSGLPGQPQEDK
jgi:CDP-diacylglycerol--glycerol-3-phosphate 3-phosphatidyltransferase